MRRTLLIFLAGLLSVAVSGCKVTSDDIDHWLGTQKGPGRIIAVLMADKYDDELRQYAGMAMVRMENREPTTGNEGIVPISELHHAIERLEPETQHRLVNAMVSNLIRMMRGEDSPQASEDGVVPPLQIRAKDAAFLLIPFATGEQQTELQNAVVDWFVADFSARRREGSYTAEQVVRQLGPTAAARLVTAMNARVENEALVNLAELVAGIGDDATKATAGERLVAIEREMESDDFRTWWNQRIREQLERNNQEMSDERVQNAINTFQNASIDDGAIPAMRFLNDQTAVSNRLFEIVNSTGNTPALNARRVRALMAMEGSVLESQVSGLLDIALSEQADPSMRDYAFRRIADSRSRAALERLWPAFTAVDNNNNERSQTWVVRQKIGNLILTIGGQAVVPQFFASLTDDNYSRPELSGYGQRLSQIQPAPTDIVNQHLSDTAWPKRCLSIFFWEFAATESDIARITALSSVSTPTSGQGWEEQNTVGAVATAVATAIRERLTAAEGGEEGESGAAAANSEGSENGNAESESDSE